MGVFHRAEMPKAPKATRHHPVSFEERFWSKVVRDDDGLKCWPWLASTVHGYGQINRDGRPRMAHRVAYELLVGPIPEGLDLDHLCRTHCCVNPAHLEPVTRGENVRRSNIYRGRRAREAQS